MTVSFDPTSYTVSEGDGNATIILVRSGDLNREVIVMFSTNDDSATSIISNVHFFKALYHFLQMVLITLL